MKAVVESQPNLDLKQTMVEKLIVEDNHTVGIRIRPASDTRPRW